MIKKWFFLFFLIFHLLSSEEPSYGYNTSYPSYSWHVYTQVSFLYWQAIQEGLKYGITNPSGQQILPNRGGKVLNMDFKYKPAFKVALGISIPHDHWEVVAEYLRFHQNTTTSSSAPQPMGSIITTWLVSQNLGFASSASARWGLKYDQLDLELAKSFYVGEKLAIKTYFGTRANWLDQDFAINYFNVFSNTGNIFSSEAISLNESNSWALGPKGGFLTNWIIGKGFRLTGKASAGIVYTRYKIKHGEENTSNTLPGVGVKDKNSFLSPMGELGLGFGWGSFFYKCRYYIDLSASYDFNVLGNQSGMQNLLNLSQGVGNSSFRDLYFHGLSATIRFEF